MEAKAIGNEDVVHQLPLSLQRLLKWERHHLHRPAAFQDASRDLRFDTRYFPQNCGAFRLPAFWILRKHLYVYGDQTRDAEEPTLLEGYQWYEKALLPFHPTSLADDRASLLRIGAQSAWPENTCVWAVPTSSTRTLLAWPDNEPHKAIFVKTSLRSPILGDRRLSRRKVARSVGLSRLFGSTKKLPTALGYFPESLGIVPRTMPHSGAIFRSIPREIKDGDFTAAPLFALFGACKNEPPLFFTILERGRLRINDLLGEVLCSNFARLWIHMSLGRGLILEAHGQDLMLALSRDLAPVGRFYYRDFEGLQVDWDLRQSCGLSMPNMPDAFRWHDTYATWGHPHSQLIWYKLHVSLSAYVDLVLGELEQVVQSWQRRGLAPGPILKDGEVASLFWSSMSQILLEMFGSGIRHKLGNSRRLTSFVTLLLTIRKDLMRAYESTSSRAAE